jgi:regulation of enolase protein 1 (concanavalin A-like superfamily)
MLQVGAFAQLPTPNYGWNLGNTLEPPCGEGCWGPPATQALINGVTNAGFNTIRIPCAWNSHANQTTYQIDSTYMARVKQVVDWCLARNLHVIINCHWDGGWLENNITGTVNPTINAKMNSYWTQIANAFTNHDHRLLFAAANEPNADNAAEMSELMTYYNTFINAVRSTGGSNSSRWLVVQGPHTDIDTTYSLMNTLPADPTPGRLMVEVHYYSPYQFTLMTADEVWGNMFYFWGPTYHSATNVSRNANWGEEAYVDAQFQKMTAKFVNAGIPVLLGEFMAMKRTSLTGADLDLHVASRTYFHKYVADTARSHGLYPMYWDTPGTAQGFNWTSGVISDPDNVTALTGGPALPPPGTGPPPAPSGLTATVASSNQINLSWTASSGAAGYIVKRSTTSGSGYSTIASSVTASYPDAGLVNGTTYYYVVAATNAYGASTDSAEASATPTVLVPLPWMTQDVGAVGVSGTAGFSNSVFTLVGAGGDIQGTADAFRFVYVAATGDCTITARVVSVQNIDAWSKAGVMIRASLNANAANAFVAVTPSNGVTWQYRSSTGGGTTWNGTGGLSAPYWVRLVRNGNTFTGYRSPNGTTWTQQGTTTISMGSTVYVGLALTSHNSASLCASVFDNVTAPGWPVSTSPDAPAVLTATAGDGDVALSWSASATATDYYVKRSTTSGSGYTIIATNVSLAFTNTGLSNGTLYYYVVRAVNASGESADSTEVSVRPTSSTPTQLNFAVVDNQFQMSWPSDHTGWQLQSQTNSLAFGLGTNWSDIAGSAETNLVMVPLASSGAVFFRLARP